jgi:hypothetical protein
MGWTAGVSFPGGVIDLYLLNSIKTASGAHPASYPMGTEALSPEAKRPGPEDNHSFTFSFKVKNDGAIPPLTHISLWHTA